MILAETGADPQLFQYLGVLLLALVVITFAVGSMVASKLAGWFFSARRARAGEPRQGARAGAGPEPGEEPGEGARARADRGAGVAGQGGPGARRGAREGARAGARGGRRV